MFFGVWKDIVFVITATFLIFIEIATRSAGAICGATTAATDCLSLPYAENGGSQTCLAGRTKGPSLKRHELQTQNNWPSTGDAACKNPVSPLFRKSTIKNGWQQPSSNTFWGDVSQQRSYTNGNGDSKKAHVVQFSQVFRSSPHWLRKKPKHAKSSIAQHSKPQSDIRKNKSCRQASPDNAWNAGSYRCSPPPQDLDKPRRIIAGCWTAIFAWPRREPSALKDFSEGRASCGLPSTRSTD